MSLWKKKKAKACIQARLRKRDSDGNIIIDMTVSNDDDFLSVYSTSHTPVISTDVAAFIENSLSGGGTRTEQMYLDALAKFDAWIFGLDTEE